MTSFSVTFQLRSFYDDSSFDLSSLVKKEYEGENLDDIFEILEDTDELDTIDDSVVINNSTEIDPIEVNIEYVVIEDEKGTEVYRDEDFSD